MNRSALLVGASGLVGGHCLRLLLENPAYSKIILLVRRSLGIRHPKLDEHVVDFDALEKYSDLLKVNDVFCCLGTTIKKAGSQEAFRKVDFTYPAEIAAIASKNGAEQFLIITALGANPRSSIFYTRVKGEVEEAVQKLPFKAIHIFRPSLLLGERAKRRPGEKIGEPVLKGLEFILVGPLRKYRTIEAAAVAAAMIAVAGKNLQGINIFESDQIQSISQTLQS